MKHKGSLSRRHPRPLAWRFVAGSRAVVVAELIIPPEVEVKIRQKHNLTGQEVREALLYARDAVAKWVEDDVYGRRLMVRGSTYLGRPVIAYMKPRNPDDENEGTFILRTAMTIDGPGSGRGERSQA
jgi:hypothetical protein